MEATQHRKIKFYESIACLIVSSNIPTLASPTRGFGLPTNNNTPLDTVIEVVSDLQKAKKNKNYKPSCCYNALAIAAYGATKSGVAELRDDSCGVGILHWCQQRIYPQGA
ncbi:MULTISPECIES: hypothetical protein [unclassified Nostoc]|uniref:hypothetical protein n=1 Tax=unclassified Nostoc TaxID=2593658 RepID=UPI0025AAFEAA|nr:MULTISPECIES: hypothetical protein [unclassified Nostoc]MDM9582180.1 hypothetical protein [Nostoc sp. GT001]MDZ7947288.1 hypothetical protein [Nostoc sp. EfeVER01]MDZ7995635.1 hypothetical protein [Nostoc sp. EspVER01]